MQNCNVIAFPSRGPSTTRLKREPIASAGFRPAVEVVHDDGGSDWVLVEALLPRRSIDAVIPAIWAALS